MLSKKRSLVRSRAHKVDTTLIIGKGGIGEEVFNQALDIIKKHEILKGKVLKNSILEAREAGEIIAENIGAEMVCSIGNKFILYKQNNKKNKLIKPLKMVAGSNASQNKRKVSKRKNISKISIKAGKFPNNLSRKQTVKYNKNERKSALY